MHSAQEVLNICRLTVLVLCASAWHDFTSVHLWHLPVSSSAHSMPFRGSTRRMQILTFSHRAGVIAVCPSLGKHYVRPLYSHPLLPMPDNLAHALSKLRGPQGQPTSPLAAMRLKRTAAQAGLSAGPPVQEGPCGKVVTSDRLRKACLRCVQASKHPHRCE